MESRHGPPVRQLLGGAAPTCSTSYLTLPSSPGAHAASLIAARPAQVPFYVIPLPPNLKARWHEALRPLVEEWAGGVPLEKTDLYGMRVYTRGSWLIPHVDREDTHALSLVFNVAQGVVDTPWPLEVDTMGDGVARAKLSPGDFTFYESARCLHGRSSPFDGARARVASVRAGPAPAREWRTAHAHSMAALPAPRRLLRQPLRALPST